jgi:hypothetical protein
MYVPLAEKLRPQEISDIVGQGHLTGTKGFLRNLIDQKKPLSILFWGRRERERQRLRRSTRSRSMASSIHLALFLAALLT